MNFFKSVFSDDPGSSDRAPEPENLQTGSQNPNPNPSLSTITTAWTFGSSLMKTLASKSESVLETYRRDLEEFSSGLKQESAVIREVASRAVKDLPTSLEAGAGLAQESLESVGKAIGNLGTTVTGIIVDGKDSILAADYSDSDTDGKSNAQQAVHIREDLQSSKPYNRIEAQIRTVQCDVNTYLEDPDDLVEYNEWKLGFKLDENGEEIENLINGEVGEIYRELVPARVDEGLFWARYFYRIYKVKKAEDARAKLVKMAISGEEDEELSWDVDEDEYEENAGSQVEDKESFKKPEKENVGEAGVSEGERGNETASRLGVCKGERGDQAEVKVGKLEVETGEKMGSAERGSKTELKGGNLEAKTDEEIVPVERGTETGLKVGNLEAETGEKIGSAERENETELKLGNLDAESSGKMVSEGKADKDSDISVVSTEASHDEDGWDEIGDIVGIEEVNDNKGVVRSSSTTRAELQKRLSVAEEEEDLTWDIEDDDDDDEPVRS